MELQIQKPSHRRLRQLFEDHLVDRFRMLSKEDGITYTLGKAGRICLHGEARGTPAPSST